MPGTLRGATGNGHRDGTASPGWVASAFHPNFFITNENLSFEEKTDQFLFGKKLLQMGLLGP
jgi:hypothetical protein